MEKRPVLMGLTSSNWHLVSMRKWEPAVPKPPQLLAGIQTQNTSHLLQHIDFRLQLQVKGLAAVARLHQRAHIVVEGLALRAWPGGRARVWGGGTGPGWLLAASSCGGRVLQQPEEGHDAPLPAAAQPAGRPGASLTAQVGAHKGHAVKDVQQGHRRLQRRARRGGKGEAHKRHHSACQQPEQRAGKRR